MIRTAHSPGPNGSATVDAQLRAINRMQAAAHRAYETISRLERELADAKRRKASAKGSGGPADVAQLHARIAELEAELQRHEHPGLHDAYRAPLEDFLRRNPDLRRVTTRALREVVGVDYDTDRESERRIGAVMRDMPGNWRPSTSVRDERTGRQARGYIR